MARKTTKDGTPFPTAKDWDKIVPMYLRGEELQHIINSFPDIHLTKTSIIQYMGRKGWTKEKKKLDMNVKDSVVQAVEDDKVKATNDCIRLYNSGAKIIEQLLSQYDVELKEGKVTKNQARATAYNVDLLMSGVTKVQKGLRVAYGMDKDGKLYEKEPEMLIIDGLNMEKI